MMNQQYSPRGFSFLPPVVKNLLIINGLAFLAYIVVGNSFSIDLNSILGMYYFGSEKFRIYQLVTYMFMHGNFTHLLFNMFAFWMFGYLLENVWGSKRFITYYFVTGIGAILIQMLVNFIQFFPIPNAIEIYSSAPSPEDFKYILETYFSGYYNKVALAEFYSHFQMVPDDVSIRNESVRILDTLYSARVNIPTVGASGAVFGILLAFGMMFPEQRIYIYFLFPIKAKWFVIIYGALELVLGLSNRPGDNVAHFAHLGGMIFGYFLIRHWKKNQFNRYM
jgi:membrane associated rhomboid family serine protease